MEVSNILIDMLQKKGAKIGANEKQIWICPKWRWKALEQIQKASISLQIKIENLEQKEADDDSAPTICERMKKTKKTTTNIERDIITMSKYVFYG